jgi:hypothetical protein
MFVGGFELIGQYENMTFWKHPDNQTLVMYLVCAELLVVCCLVASHASPFRPAFFAATQSTFEPDNVTAYMNALVQGVEAGRSFGLYRFMMDFTDNGGGDICTFVLHLFLRGGDRELTHLSMRQVLALRCWTTCSVPPTTSVCRPRTCRQTRSLWTWPHAPPRRAQTTRFGALRRTNPTRPNTRGPTLT